MAAKKGSIVTKVTTRDLRLEVLDSDGHWAHMAEADGEDQEGLNWITDLAATIKKGPIKYRLIERTATTRVQTSETVVEGEAMEPTPVKGMS